jgi:hypothetical protein
MMLLVPALTRMPLLSLTAVIVGPSETIQPWSAPSPAMRRRSTGMVSVQ